MVGAAIAAELINAAPAHLADYRRPEQYPRIKIVKDCATAAELMVLSVT